MPEKLISSRTPEDTATDTADFAAWESEFSITPSVEESTTPDRVEFNEVIPSPTEIVSVAQDRVGAALKAKDETDPEMSSANETEAEAETIEENDADDETANSPYEGKVARFKSVVANKLSNVVDRIDQSAENSEQKYDNKAKNTLRDTGKSALEVSPTVATEAESIKAISEKRGGLRGVLKSIASRAKARWNARSEQRKSADPEQIYQNQVRNEQDLERSRAKMMQEREKAFSNQSETDTSQLAAESTEEPVSEQHSEAYQHYDEASAEYDEVEQDQAAEHQRIANQARAARVAKQRRMLNRKENWSDFKESVSKSRAGRFGKAIARYTKNTAAHIKGQRVPTTPQVSSEERAARMAEISE